MIDVEPAVVVVVQQRHARADRLQDVGFCGVPILCFQTVRPAFSEMSWKTTGPVLTNPPAVIGRFSESRTGANTPPVADPV